MRHIPPYLRLVVDNTREFAAQRLIFPERKITLPREVAPNGACWVDGRYIVPLAYIKEEHRRRPTIVPPPSPLLGTKEPRKW